MGWVLQVVIYYVLAVLHIEGEVNIHEAPRHKRIRAGKTVTFSCTASSDSLLYGIPTIHWRRDDEAISYTSNGRVSVNLVDNSLTLRNVSTMDTGLYTCVANVGQEIAKSGAQLIVEDVPDPPIDVELTFCQARLAQIQWKLINENYSPVSQFVIQYNTSFEPDVWHTAKTRLPRNQYYQRIALSPWGNYSFRVIAQNEIGYSKPSQQTSEVCSMPPDVPHHNPKHVCTKNIRPHTLVIIWQPMSITEHNAPGFYYLVKWRRHDLAGSREFEERIVESHLSELTIEDQPVYKPYDLYVLAINSVGEAVSPPKMVLGYSAESVPLEVPRNFRIDPDKELTDTTADFLWDSVNTGPWRMQGFFRGYKIQFWKTTPGMSTIREHSIIYREPEPCGAGERHKRDVSSGHVYNLWPYTNVTAQIVAMNAKYEGAPSNKVHFTTKEGEPGPVNSFSVVRRGSTHLELSWEKPKVINGILIGYSIAYEVINSNEYHQKEELDLNDPSMTGLKIRGLLPDHAYRISIWARSRIGRGQVYLIDDTTLPEGPPVAPNFTTVNISKRAINVTWFPSTRGNPGSVFTVYYRRLGELHWKSTQDETDRNWSVVSGLVPGVIYEMRVIARNGDGEEGHETSSPVRRVRIGVRRDLSQPTFKVLFLSEDSFGVGLVSYNRAVVSFYVQYRKLGGDQWRTTDDTLRDQWAVIHDLDAGHMYQIRVVTKSDLGESVSLVQDVIAGKDPDAQAAISDNNAPGSAAFTCPYLLLHLLLPLLVILLITVPPVSTSLL